MPCRMDDSGHWWSIVTKAEVIRLESYPWEMLGLTWACILQFTLLMTLVFVLLPPPSPPKGVFFALDTIYLVFEFASYLSCVFRSMSCLLALPFAYLVLCLAESCYIFILHTTTPIFFFVPVVILLAWLRQNSCTLRLAIPPPCYKTLKYCCQLYYFSAYIHD